MPNSEEIYRIFVVDDRSLPRIAARSMIQASDHLAFAGEADSGTKALEAIGHAKPDVVLIDVEMPTPSGPETVANLRAAGVTAKLIGWTVSESSDDLLRMLAAGADGYALKDVGPAEFERTILATVRGELALPRKLVSGVVARAIRGGTPSRAAAIELTARESEALRWLAKGTPVKRIAREMTVSAASVDFYLRGIYRKLGVRSRGEATRAALRLGLLDLTDLE